MARTSFTLDLCTITWEWQGYCCKNSKLRLLQYQTPYLCLLLYLCFMLSQLLGFKKCGNGFWQPSYLLLLQLQYFIPGFFGTPAPYFRSLCFFGFVFIIRILKNKKICGSFWLAFSPESFLIFITLQHYQ